MNFFYVYFSDQHLEQLRMLVLSILTVRQFYPANEIVVIDYSGDQRLNEFSKRYNFRVIRTRPCYADKKHVRPYMVSKPMDCIVAAESLGMKEVVILDSDVFILNPFSPIDFNKFSVFNRENTGYNSGVLFFSAGSESLEVFKDLYRFVVERCNESVEFVHSCHAVFGRKPVNHINEETLMGATIERLPFFKNRYYSNIGTDNHGHLDFFVNHPEERFNNIHFLGYTLNNMGAATSAKYQYPLSLEGFGFLKGVVDEDFFGIKPTFDLSFNDFRKRLGKAVVGSKQRLFL